MWSGSSHEPKNTLDVEQSQIYILESFLLPQGLVELRLGTNREFFFFFSNTGER